MDIERLKEIEKIYHAALEIAPAERESFFKEHCGADEELRREVESLLSFENSSDNILDFTPESLAAEMFADKKIEHIVGRQIKHYKILSLLGKGGMGAVYLAEDSKLDRKIAVKLLSKEFGRDTDNLKRFVREAKAASALNHPNILTVYEIGEAGGINYIATEFIDGKVLSQHNSKEKITLESVLDISIQIVSALQTAHEVGIVHRDIKPDNVMIRKDGIVKVLDFGLAKLLEKQSANALDLEAATVAKSITSPGMIMGTPNYMSPEQARGKGITHQTDIFSFGIVLYEMLSGRLPFQGESPMDVIGAILHKEPIPLIEILPQVPRDIEYIVNKSLRKNTDERYQNTKDLLTDLRRIKQRLDYEKVGRSFSPEDSNADLEGQETKIFDSSDFAQINNAPPNNLSRDIPNLIGREAETAEILDLLRESETRLLTITGVGGTGKTRLADAVSHLSLAEFLGGVYFIPLAPIDNHELVLPVIAQNLGVREESGKSLRKSLIEHLRGKKMLIVLDNFEQIMKAAPLIGELLAGSQNLKILVTSRVRLNLNFEREFTLQPLIVPTNKKLSANEFGKFPAIELFVKRAKAAKSDFRLTEENAVFVAEICRRLEGLPLAIELAAARVKLFAPVAILNRLENSLNLLTGGAKDLPKRQQTMRGAIAWSYDLLDADEKKLLNRLSVFRGGFTLEGADSVQSPRFSVSARQQSAAGEQPEGWTPNTDSTADLLDVISSLVDKSLLVQREQADGEPRFRMLVVVREFAFEKLAESGEAEEIRRRHADFYNALSEKAGSEIYGAKAAEWCEKLEREHDNIRAALRWALDNEPKIALQIALSNYLFWLRQGYLAEGCGWMTEALEKSDGDADLKLRVNVYRKAAYLFGRRGDTETAESYGEEALRLSREIEDKKSITYSLSALATAKNAKGDFKQARKFAEEGLAIAREINDQMQIGHLLNSLGEIARGEKDYGAARKYYEDALEISQQESHVNSHYYMGNLACMTYLLGDYKAARSYALEVLKLQEEFGDKVIIAQSTGVMAAVALKEGKPEKAARLSGAEAAIHEAVGNKPGKVDQDFIDIYNSEVRTEIGDEAFDAAFAEGGKLNIEEAIALAREGESEFEKETHITNEANSDTQSYLKTDTLESQTLIIPPSETTATEISRPNNFYSRFRQKRIFAAALIIIFLTAGAFFGYRYLTANQQVRSIAVMPFVNETGNPDNEYLSDGLTDALINKLSELPQMKVISRSSTFKYKGREIETGEIAKTLGVQAIVTGRITQQGDMLQISVEMINAAENTQIWGEQYNRKVSNMLDVQQEIARTVSEKLRLQLSGKEEQQIAKQATGNSQAYQYYLSGVFYQRRNGADNLKRAIEYQKQAIALDPNFALAYSELSLNYGALIEIGAIDPADGKPKARAAAEKAVALDETLPEGHFALGYVENQDLDWTKAEQNFKRTIELNPNFAGAHTLYAAYLSQLGRTDEALTEINQAQELDPLRVGLIGNEGIILYYARRYDEAILKMQEGLKTEPENAPARVYLGQAYIADRQYTKAINELKTADKTDSESTNALIYLGCAEMLSGNHNEAAAILTRLQTTKKYVSPAALAILYAALGDKDAAFKSIEKAYAERDLNLQFLKVEPGYDSLREDSRFKEWLLKVRFPQ